MTTVQGVGPVLEALRAGRRQVRRVWIARERGRDPRILAIEEEARRRGIPVEGVDRDYVARRADGPGHQGVVAEAEPLPRVELDGLIERREGDEPLIVVLDGVQDPQNLGAILRSAECAGARGVIVPRDRSVRLTAAVVKVAEGAAEHVPVVEVTNLARALKALAEGGIWSTGFEGDVAKPWFEADFRGPTALVFGSEGEGMRRLVRETCDDLVGIPLRGQLRSLNVAAAAAAGLFEAVRQRDSASRGKGLARPRLDPYT